MCFVAVIVARLTILAKKVWEKVKGFFFVATDRVAKKIFFSRFLKVQVVLSIFSIKLNLR